MDFRKLKSFVAAANRLSFTQAGRELDISQAAVSQNIRNLEEQLGITLFRREGRRVQLTDHGHQLLSMATEILRLVERAGQIGKISTVISGELTIATSTVPSEQILPGLLADFRRRHPQVRESVLVSDSRETAVAVESGKANLGFIGEEPTSPNLQSVAIAEDELVLAVANSHAFAATGRATLRQLQEQPLIAREAGSGSWHCLKRELKKHQLHTRDLMIAMEVNSNDAIRAAVQRGIGVAFFSRSTPFRKLGLTAVNIRGFRPKRQLFLIFYSGVELPSAANEFLRFVIDQSPFNTGTAIER